MELKDIIEKIGTAFETFKAENDIRLKEIEAKGHADPLLAEKVEKINAEMLEISAMKRQLETLEKVASRGAFGGGTSEIDKAKAEHAKVFDKWFRKGGDGPPTAARLNELAVKAELSTLSDPDGGFITAPPTVESTIDRVVGTMSAMRRICSVMSIGSDTYEKYVNQGGNTHGWVGEKEARTETGTPTLRKITINMKELYSMPATTQTLLDDAIKDVGAWLADEVSIDFAEAEGDAFINADGVAAPKGLDAYAKVANSSYAWGSLGYIAGGHASLLNNADKLKDLKRSLKPTYRNGAVWLMNDTTAGIIDKFKDGDGNYIWRPGLLADAPDTLLGKPIEYDDNIEDIGTGNFPIYFGNFNRGYLIIDRMGIRVIRDNLTEKGKVLFYTTKRVGGGVVMYEAIKCLKIAAS